MSTEEAPEGESPPQTDLGRRSTPCKLWLYTNFDCNLRCSYCVTESLPTAPRRALGLANVQRLVDEAVALGFEHILFTGGEPFILTEIYDMLAYSSAQVKTTVLTNATLMRGKRLDRLCAVASDNLTVQVSLDGACAEDHDAYRGHGTWTRAVEGIRLMQSRGAHITISTTTTPANSDRLDELRDFVRGLGIPDSDHLIRPLAKRGFSQEGLEVGADNLVPEVTVTMDGVYWHPLVSPSDADMRVTQQVFPLVDAVTAIQKQLDAQELGGNTERAEFT